MEEKLRQKDSVIEKLRLKNSTIKAQIVKMEQQLAHKEEMGEVQAHASLPAGPHLQYGMLRVCMRRCCTWWTLISSRLRTNSTWKR
jgi:hypothetical protein